MMGHLTREERRLIDAALARTPVEARRVPTGASAFAVDYQWDGKKLVDVTQIDARLVIRNSFSGALALRRGEQRLLIAEDIRAGMTLHEIRDRRGVTGELIKSVAHIFGLDLDRNSAAGPGKDAELTGKIVVAANGRRDAAQIAKIVGCDADEVRARRDALGLNIPKRAKQEAAA